MFYKQFFMKVFFYLSQGFFKSFISKVCPLKTVAVKYDKYIPTGCCGFENNRYIISIGASGFLDFLPNSSVAKGYINISNKTMMNKAYSIHSGILLGLFYHEMGHVLYTFFADASYKDTASCRQLFNVLEDMYIEICMSSRSRVAKKCLSYLKKLETSHRHFNIPRMRADIIPEIANFLHVYMLVGAKKCNETCPFYNDHKVEIDKYLYNFYHEADAEARYNICRDLYKYLIDHGAEEGYVDSDEIDLSASGTGQSSPLPGIAFPAPGSSSSSSSSNTSNASSSSGKEGGEESDEEGDENGKEFNRNNPNQNVQSTTGVGDSKSDGGLSISGKNIPGSSVPNTFDSGFDLSQAIGFDPDSVDSNLNAEIIDNPVTEEECDYSAMTIEHMFEERDSEVSKIADHLFVYTNSVDVTSNSLDKKVDKILTKHDNTIEDCINEINECITVQNSYPIAEYSSGKFDLNSYIKDKNLFKSFSRPSGADLDVDLSFYILCDVSGSMSGEKSSLCTESLMVLYECLNRLDIPFEVGAFSTDNFDGAKQTAVTFVPKTFSDEPNSCKNFLMAFDWSYYSRCFNFDSDMMFNCNYDEVSIHHCLDKLKQQSNKDKVMIVLSDGATCGSVDVLRSVVKQAEDDGILMLGVGICSDNVASIYDNHVLFETPEDLKRFPKFLSDYLQSFYES